MLEESISKRLHYYFVGDWISVTKDEAQRNKYFGFWGWLLVIYLALLYSFIEQLLALLGLLPGVDPFSPDNIGSAALFSPLESLPSYALLLPFFVLAPLKHRLMPKVTIICIWLGILPMISATLGSPSDERLIALVATALFTALFSWYLLRSRRVNVTYFYRVPSSPTKQSSHPNGVTSHRTKLWMRLYWVFFVILAIVSIIGLAEYLIEHGE